ncbi:MAG: hypothetical protein JXA89_10705, partial [Anaerolineae bacterium]|nr:hypothetical protein [Anaerolineae bacterium]
KWETDVGQLRLIDGSRQQDPANLAVVERRTFFPFKRRGKGQLYVLLELSGGSFGREDLCHELVTAITEEYFRTPGTVTYGLRQAILLANTQLVRENAKVNSEHRLGGVACIVLRDDELFVAQVGWPMVYLVHREQVQTFPDTLLESQDISMLGQHQTANVRMFHAAIHPQDMILMADGPMARQLGITRIGQILAGNVQQAMHNLEALAPPEDCTAVVIHLGGTATPLAAQAERWAFVDVERPEQQPEESPQGPPAAVPPSFEYDHQLVPSAKQDSGPGAPKEEADVPSSYVDEFEPDSFEQPVPVQKASSGSDLGERVATLVKGLGQGARTFAERMLPEKDPGSEARRARRRRSAARTRRRGKPDEQPTKWWLAAAVAVPLLALLFVVLYTWYRGWSQQSQFNAKLEAAQSKRDIALSSSESPVVARDYWLEVISLSDDAAQLQPDSPEMLQLRAQAETEIDRIDGITRLGQSYKLYEYPSSPSRVIVSVLDVYVLDRGMGNVYHHALNDVRNGLRNPSAEQVLIQQGQPVEGQNVNNLIDIAWIKDGGERQAGALLILDDAGLLLEYDPTWEKFQSLAVGGVSEWRSPYALSTFDSNLYLLDPLANQIFKYWNQQYASEPSRWIAQEGVSIATAIDIGIDGNIYLLHQDGRITKYFGGEVAPFALTRMPLPLSSADAMYIDVDQVAQYIYIADSAEQRVVQIDREGVFVRQFKPAREQEASFRQLMDIFVDEMAGKLFYISGNALYVTDIPPVQR